MHRLSITVLFFRVLLEQDRLQWQLNAKVVIRDKMTAPFVCAGATGATGATGNDGGTGATGKDGFPILVHVATKLLHYPSA